MVRRFACAEQKRGPSLGGGVTQKLNHGCVPGRAAIDGSKQHYQCTAISCRLAGPSLNPIFHTDKQTVITVRRNADNRGMRCFPYGLRSRPNQAKRGEFPHLELMLAPRIELAEQLIE